MNKYKDKMRISNRRIRKAKELLANAEKQKEKRADKEAEHRMAHQKRVKLHNEILSQFKERYTNEMVATFERDVKPEFEEGEEVVLNWYVKGNSWEGGIRANFSHVEPELGPAHVIIEKRWVDTAYISEYIEELSGADKFGWLHESSPYSVFLDKVDKSRMGNGPRPVLPWIGWEYSFRFVDEKLKKPSWGLREPNFLKIGSDEEKVVKEIWNLEQSSKEAQNRISELQEERNKLQTIANMKAELSGKFYVGSF